MTTRALDAIHAKLLKLDGRQQDMGLPMLADLDCSWRDRKHEVISRMLAMGDARPSYDLLAAAGAHLVALMAAVDAAEEVDVASGAEEAA